jgi:tocopherol cyclase
MEINRKEHSAASLCNHLKPSRPGWLPVYNIRKIWNPSWFQGNNKTENYFEGWYYKIVSRNMSAVYAVIPGISIPSSPDPAFAFIQIIDGRSGASRFIRYPISDFTFSGNRFAVNIGTNSFTENRIVLSTGNDEISVTGQLNLSGLQPYPSRLFSPGVMGWYRFVPGMQCYHDIVSMNHGIEGHLNINCRLIDFTGGRGYLEKDWGSSMPLAWVWMQSNHFERDDLSLSVSVAHVPWSRSAFSGFLAVLGTVDRIYRFTTYTHARIRELDIREHSIRLVFTDNRHTLKIEASGQQFGYLKAPVQGMMSRNINESIGAAIAIELTDRKQQVIISGRGNPAGLEIVGDPDIIYRHLRERLA